MPHQIMMQASTLRVQLQVEETFQAGVSQDDKVAADSISLQYYTCNTSTFGTLSWAMSMPNPSPIVTLAPPSPIHACKHASCGSKAPSHNLQTSKQLAPICGFVLSLKSRLSSTNFQKVMPVASVCCSPEPSCLYVDHHK